MIIMVTNDNYNEGGIYRLYMYMYICIYIYTYELYYYHNLILFLFLRTISLAPNTSHSKADCTPSPVLADPTEKATRFPMFDEEEEEGWDDDDDDDVEWEENKEERCCC